MLQNLGATELILIALVLVFLFGGKKLPELANGVGNAIQSFRKAVKEEV